MLTNKVALFAIIALLTIVTLLIQHTPEVEKHTRKNIMQQQQLYYQKIYTMFLVPCCESEAILLKNFSSRLPRVYITKVSSRLPRSRLWKRDLFTRASKKTKKKIGARRDNRDYLKTDPFIISFFYHYFCHFVKLIRKLEYLNLNPYYYWIAVYWKTKKVHNTLTALIYIHTAIKLSLLPWQWC